MLLSTLLLFENMCLAGCISWARMSLSVLADHKISASLQQLCYKD